VQQQEMGWLAKHGSTRDDSKNGAGKKAGCVPASGVESFMLSDHRPSDNQLPLHFPATPFMAPKSKSVGEGGLGRTMEGGWRRTPSQTRASLSNSY